MSFDFDFTAGRPSSAPAAAASAKPLRSEWRRLGRTFRSARGAETLEKTRTEIAVFGHKAHAAPADLGHQASIERHIAEAGAAVAGIDVLVNNARHALNTCDFGAPIRYQAPTVGRRSFEGEFLPVRIGPNPLFERTIHV